MNQLKMLEKHFEVLAREFSKSSSLETCCFLLTNNESPPEGGLILVSEVITLTDMDYEIREENRLSVSPATMLRIAKIAKERDLSICMVHNHPMENGQVFFSLADDIGNTSSFRFFCRFLNSNFHSCLVWNKHLSSVAGRIYYSADKFEEISNIEVHGSRYSKIRTSVLRTETAVDYSTFDRQVKLLGVEGMKSISNKTIVIVGVGGIGSCINQILCHSGFENIIVIDPDIFEASNRPRIPGNIPSDVKNKTDKIDIAIRYAKAFNPKINIRGIKHRIEQKKLLGLFANCFAVICCTDNTVSRAHLNQVCQQFYVPIIDTGVEFAVNEKGEISSEVGKVNLVLPGKACLQCSNHLSADKIQAEMASSSIQHNEYIKSEEVKEPSMMPFNMEIASRSVQILIFYMTGICDVAIDVYEQFSFLGLKGRSHVKTIRKRQGEECLFCGRDSQLLGQGSSSKLIIRQSA